MVEEQRGYAAGQESRPEGSSGPISDELVPAVRQVPFSRDIDTLLRTCTTCFKCECLHLDTISVLTSTHRIS